jgi:ferredoxin
MAFIPELAKYGDKVTIWPKDQTGRANLSEILASPQVGALVYACGPQPLLDGISEAMQSWPVESLRMERFTPKKLGAPVLSTPFEVVLARSGQVVTVKPDRSILDAVAEVGVDVLSSCKQGTCGTCETRVLDGKPDHRDSVLGERAQALGDTMMICVSRSCTDRLTLDL